MSTSTPPIRLATTVILTRDGADGIEVFMVKRHGRSSFMANAYVYPGGALDAADEQEALWRHVEGVSPDEAAARLAVDSPTRAMGLLLAGVRETFEESGALIARRPDETALVDLLGDAALTARFEAARHALHEGSRSLASLLMKEDLVVPLDRLGFFAHWITPTFERKRFDTYFLVARAPVDQRPLHDAKETTHSAWVRPQDALAAYARGEWFLAPPTLITLHQLARHDSVDALLAFAHAYMPPTLLPHLDADADTPTLLFPGDPAYPTETPEYAIATPNDEPWTRMWMEDGRWIAGTPDGPVVV